MWTQILLKICENLAEVYSADGSAFVSVPVFDLVFGFVKLFVLNPVFYCKIGFYVGGKAVCGSDERAVSVRNFFELVFSKKYRNKEF